MKQNDFKYMLGHDKHYRNAFILAAAVPIACAAAAVIILCGRGFFWPLFMPCSIKQITGFHCVSCGATRSTLALFDGDFISAVYYNPLYIAFLGWLAYLYARVTLSLMVRPYRRYTPSLTWKSAVAAGAVIVTFTVIRNLPFYRAIFY